MGDVHTWNSSHWKGLTLCTRTKERVELRTWLFFANADCLFISQIQADPNSYYTPAKSESKRWSPTAIIMGREKRVEELIVTKAVIESGEKIHCSILPEVSLWDGLVPCEAASHVNKRSVYFGATDNPFVLVPRSIMTFLKMPS